MLRSWLAKVAKNRTNAEEVVIKSGEKLKHGEFLGWKNLKKVTILGPVELPSACFSGCEQLREVTGSEYITRVGAHSFQKCENLAYLKIAPDTMIEEEGFAFSGLQSIDLTGYTNMDNIGEKAFLYCQYLSHIILPNNMDRVPAQMFSGCRSLMRVYIPRSVKLIGEGAFFFTAMASVKIPASVEEIQPFAFKATRLTSVDFSEAKSLAIIGDEAFAGTNLELVDLRNTRMDINEARQAFDEGISIITNKV